MTAGRGLLLWLALVLSIVELGASMTDRLTLSRMLAPVVWGLLGYAFAPVIDSWLERRRLERSEETLARRHADLDRQARESIRVRLLRDFGVDRPDAVGYQWSPFEGRLIVRRSVDGVIIDETFEDMVERDGER